MDDLVKRLRDDPGLADCEEAADRIEALEARVAAADKLAEALPRWRRAMADWDEGGEAALDEMDRLEAAYAARQERLAKARAARKTKETAE
jgi:hypothetical protein